MTRTREVPEWSGRLRRWTPVALLALVIVVVAATVLAAWGSGAGEGSTVTDVGALPTRAAPPTPASPDAASPDAHEVVDPVLAPSAGAAPAVPDIEVSIPAPEPPPASSSGGSGAGGSGYGRSGPGGGLGPADYATYCASPATPYGASSAQGLLTAANRERARLGIAPLSWSGSLAEAASDWSRTMARTGTFAHGAGAGSAENIGTVSYSAGYSEAQAAGAMHAGWMRSSAHCRNLMNPAYSRMGAGVASAAGGTRWYGTQLLQ